MHAETLQSHSLHLFFLVAPDFLNVPSVKKCEGVGAVEAPGGILYHCYRINEEGKIERSDCVIPTNQNNANIYYDLKKLVEELVAQGKDATCVVAR
jgi:coenzyme F420-reducing hydrogenase alpha subunit